jgi:CHAD domain-containing protein
LRKATAEDLASGLKRIYKQGREAFKTARKSPTPGHLHAWRKKTKSLGYGLEMIKNLGSGELSKMIRCSDILTEALGDDQDLFMVLRALDKEHRSNPASDFDRLANRISLKRAKRQKRAFKLGEKVYGEKSGGFEKRLDRYLRRARKQ